MERYLSKYSSFMEGKRVRIDSEFQSEKCAKRSFVGDDDDDDRISKLADEILVNILSLLSFKEAARTSVLSSRWINLWKHTTSLDFEAQSKLDKIKKRFNLLESERRKYVKWVNSVIRSHKSPTLKEFKIRFDLNRSSKNSITQWLQFAFSKQVERLEFDLENCGDFSEYYRFPKELLTLNSCKEAPKLKPPFDIFCTHNPHVINDYKSIKELSFKSVYFADGIIEFFLHNCPFLERLVVHDSDKTSNLEVCGPFLRLKHLEIVRCLGLKSLKVSLPNLTSLRVTRFDELLVENVPMLVDVTVNCDDDSISLKRRFSALSCCISQLETLCLEVTSLELNSREPIGPHEFLQLPKLKKLIAKFDDAKGCESIVWLADLISASPQLEELVLKYEWCEHQRVDRQVKHAIKKNGKQRLEPHIPQHVKLVIV